MIKNITLSDLQEIIDNFSEFSFDNLYGVSFFNVFGDVIYNSVPDFDAKEFNIDQDIAKIPWEQLIEDPYFISSRKDFFLIVRNFHNLFIFAMIFNPQAKIGILKNIFLEGIKIIERGFINNPVLRNLRESANVTGFISKL